jgi:putative glutamine amidotransferase
VHGPAPHVGLKASYAETIVAFGGVPLIIPASFTNGQLRVVYGRISALMLPGGVDIDPRCYGSMPTHRMGEVDAQLDTVELALAQWAIADGMPILGLCRGAQVLNVAAGGTLHQDLPTELPSKVVHRRKGALRYNPVHDIDIVPDSALAGVVGAGRIRVNSTHHQAVKGVAPGWRIAATAPDGVIEAIEREYSAAFALGIQCHPEEMWSSLEPVFGGLFEGFVQAASRFAIEHR